MGTWVNKDGLVVRLGTTEAEVTRAGWFSDDTVNSMFEVVIDLANVGSSDALLEDTQDIVIPSGFLPYEVRILTETAATGSSATLNVGLWQQSDRSTVLSSTALLAAAPRTDWATVDTSFTYKVGTTGVGNKVGAPLASVTADAHSGYILSASYSTAAFSAGRIRVQVVGEFARPSPSNP
jgi:hypothetical protein